MWQPQSLKLPQYIADTIATLSMYFHFSQWYSDFTYAGRLMHITVRSHYIIQHRKGQFIHYIIRHHTTINNSGAVYTYSTIDWIVCCHCVCNLDANDIIMICSSSVLSPIARHWTWVGICSSYAACRQIDTYREGGRGLYALSLTQTYTPHIRQIDTYEGHC